MAYEIVESCFDTVFIDKNIAIILMLAYFTSGVFTHPKEVLGQLCPPLLRPLWV